MKKIIPIIALIGASAFVVIGSSNTTKKDGYINNIDSFKEDLSNYTNLTDTKLTKTAFNKYNLSILNDNLDDLNTIDNNISTLNEDIATETENDNTLDIDIEDNQEDILDTPENEEIKQENDDQIVIPENISTLYSLSEDISSSCDDFCELKKEITNAIIETQNLINKIQSKELDLTKEQRMFITEQSCQLKNLGRQLSSITTELSFELSDLNQIMATNDANIDTLNLKYLVVLDNMINGNEMLQSSLNSLNLINQIFNMKTSLPPNNTGRILYGFQQNDNPPIIKDYLIDENGNMVENSDTLEQNDGNSNSQESAEEVSEEKSTTIDTYKNNALNTNIDTYQNRQTPRNIDSFFNTALLDNEFMYGNGGYGYAGMNGMYGPANPYMQNYANYERNNTNYTPNNMNNTQHIETNQNNQQQETESKKETKIKKLKKNIDTYKDENEPDIKTKLGNIKNSINGFFNKFKISDLKVDLNDKIDNPIYRFDSKNS